MSLFDDVKIFLPKYLSEDATVRLFNELGMFPENINDRMYALLPNYSAFALQGDGLSDLLLVNFPDTDVRQGPCMLLSNTCDMSEENPRKFPIHATYAPIFKLDAYSRFLIGDGIYDKTSIDSHLCDLRQQSISNMFYLPATQSLQYEGVVFFDRLNNCPVSEFQKSNLSKRKLFSLSDYGFYLFLFKLSIHFNRVREQISRG